MIQVEEVTTVDRFEALRPEWSALFERCPGATPFQSPEWLLPWWRSFGRGRLWVLALRREGGLAGLAPFFIGALSEGGPRHVWLIGTGISDTLDLLLDPGFEPIGAARVLDHLLLQQKEWDLCDFQELRAGSPLLTAASISRLSQEIVPQGASPCLPLPRTEAAFQRMLSPEHRRKLRRARRRLEAAGRFSFERADEGTLPEFLDALFRLHERRWGKRQGAGVLADPTLRTFHREAAAGFLKRDALRLYVLQLNGIPIASLYAFQKGGGLSCYLTGFDPEKMPYSPGALLLEYVIEAAIRDGLQEADFLRGQEPYKYLWGASDRPHYRLWMAAAPAMLPRILDQGEKAGVIENR